MKKTLIAIAVAALSTAAYADGRGGEGVDVRATTNVLELNQTSVSLNQEASKGIEYSGQYDVRNVPGVVAPNLTTTLTETCMGSTSVGGAGVGFGFSFGTTWRDSACVRRLDARQVAALGFRDAAVQLMCDSEAVAAAFARAGYTNCGAGQPAPEPREAAPAPALGATESTGTDPFWFQNN